MPQIPESDAFALAQNIDTLSSEEKPQALDILKRYQQQQIDNGEPEWPSQVAAQQQATQKLRGLFTGGLDAAQLPVSPFSSDPKRDKAIMANVQFLTARTGKTAQEIADRYDFYKGDYAAQKWQKTNIDDVGFYDAAAKEIQRDQQLDDTTLEGAKAALRGEPIGAALQAWQQKNSDRMPDSSQFMRGFMGARAKAGEHLQFADELMKLLESGSGMTKGGQLTGQTYDTEQAAQFEDMLGKLAEMKPKDRKQVYGILGAKAEAAGYDQKGFWAQMLGQIDKGLARAGSTLGTQAGVAGDVAANLPAMLSNTMKPEEFAATDASIAKRHAVGEVHDELARIVSGAIDPVKPTVGWLNDSVEKGLIQAPGAVLPFMAASAALGPWGAGALFTADFAEQNRRELRAQGIDNDKAVAIGAAAAPFQAAVESLSNTLQLGRFPAVQAALARFTKPIAGGAGLMTRYGMNLAISFGTEFTEEQLQDNVIRPAVQNVVAAFDQDVPQVGLGQIYENIKASSPELAFTLAPMALVFGGVMTGAQANLSSAMIDSQDLLEAAGYSASQANAIRSEATEESKIAKAREFWLNREGTPKTMEDAAKSYSERIKLLQTDAAAAQADLEQRGVLPRMLHAADDRWRLTFNDGSTAEFNSHQEADAARWQWVTDKLGDMHASVRQQIAQMEKGADVGRELAVEFKPEERYATPEEMARPDFQARIKQGDILDNPDAAYHDSIAIGKATGEEEALPQILGSSVNEFKDGVLRTTVKLYEGANILTLVEEKLEGDAKAILSSQTGRDWMLQHLRAYEQASGDKLFAEADDSKLTDKMLVEAWSHLGQYYLVGNSKKGAALGAGGMRKMFADAVRAGLGGSLNAEAQFFGQVWQRASRLSKAKREGKLGADLVAELEKQLGIDSQVKHEQGSMQAAEDMGNEALNGIDLSTTSPTAYSEDNPGPNGETFSARKFNFASQLAPAAQTIQQMRQKGATVDFAKAYQAAAVGQSTAMLSLDAIYKQALAQNPKLTEADFGKQVQALYNSGYLMLEPGESAQTMRDTLARFGVKDSLGIPSMFAAPMQAQDGQTYSIRPSDYESRITAAFSPFQRDPELRLRVAQVAKARAQRLGAEWLEKAAVLRAAKDINRESRVREALAYDDKVKAYLDALTPEARQELEQDFAGLESDPLIAAMLDHGRLMSFTTAKKLGKVEAKSGDYDNVPFLPRSWYSKGAGIMPDQMAQAMHDAGLLKDGYADTLWKELTARLESHAKNKAAYDKAQADFKAAEKQARTDAKAESDTWAAAERKKATSPKSQREMLKGALRTLDGILSAAPPEVRARVGGYVKLAGLATDEAMLDEIERRIAKLNTELEKWLKKEGRSKLEKLITKGLPKGEAGKKAKGKDADMHHLFSAAESAAKLDAAGVTARLAELDSRLASGELTPEQEALAMAERGVVELVGDLKNADSSRIFSAIDTLNDIYTEGWLKWKLAQIERREKRAGLRHDFIKATGKAGLQAERRAADEEAKSLLGTPKGLALSLSSLHEVLSYAFGKAAMVNDFVDAERDASGQYEDASQALGDEIEKLFANMAGGDVLAGERLRFDMSQRNVEVSKLGKMSQTEIIQALLIWAQEDGRRHMEGTRNEAGDITSTWSYDQAWIDELRSKQTADGKRLMAWLTQKYGAEWSALNPLYRKRYGVNLPHHDNYAPLTVKPMQAKAGEVVDPVTGGTITSGSVITPGSLRTRSASAVAEPDFRDALQTFVAHTRQLEYWKAYYDLASEMSAILGNREVMNAVHAKGGQAAEMALQKWVDAIAMNGFHDASATLATSDWIRKLSSNAATVALLGRVPTLLVQSAQLAAASVKMPVGAYLKRFGKLWAGVIPGFKAPNIWGDAINSDFIQRRYKAAPPILQQAMQNLANQKEPNKIKHYAAQLGKLLSGADALFTSGTYAMLLDYHRETGAKLGLSGTELEEFARTEAERDTEAVAQPTRMTTRSLAEITNTSPMGKVVWAFASESRQKIALMAWAAANGKNDPATAIKTAFLVFGVGGLMTQVLKNLWKEAKGDDDEKKWSAERLMIAAIAGPLQGIPGASELSGDPGLISGVKWATPALKHVAEGKGTMRDVEALMNAAGYFNDTAAGVAALSHLGFDFARVLENLAGQK